MEEDSGAADPVHEASLIVVELLRRAQALEELKEVAPHALDTLCEAMALAEEADYSPHLPVTWSFANVYLTLYKEAASAAFSSNPADIERAAFLTYALQTFSPATPLAYALSAWLTIRCDGDFERASAYLSCLLQQLSQESESKTELEVLHAFCVFRCCPGSRETASCIEKVLTKASLLAASPKGHASSRGDRLAALCELLLAEQQPDEPAAAAAAGSSRASRGALARVYLRRCSTLPPGGDELANLVARSFSLFTPSSAHAGDPFLRGVGLPAAGPSVPSAVRRIFFPSVPLPPLSCRWKTALYRQKPPAGSPLRAVAVPRWNPAPPVSPPTPASLFAAALRAAPPPGDWVSAVRAAVAAVVAACAPAPRCCCCGCAPPGQALCSLPSKARAEAVCPKQQVQRCHEHAPKDVPTARSFDQTFAGCEPSLQPARNLCSLPSKACAEAVCPKQQIQRCQEQAPKDVPTARSFDQTFAGCEPPLQPESVSLEWQPQVSRKRQEQAPKDEPSVHDLRSAGRDPSLQPGQNPRRLPSKSRAESVYLKHQPQVSRKRQRDTPKDERSAQDFDPNSADCDAPLQPVQNPRRLPSKSRAESVYPLVSRKRKEQTPKDEPAQDFDPNSSGCDPPLQPAQTPRRLLKSRAGSVYLKHQPEVSRKRQEQTPKDEPSAQDFGSNSADCDLKQQPQVSRKCQEQAPKDEPSAEDFDPKFAGCDPPLQPAQNPRRLPSKSRAGSVYLEHQPRVFRKCPEPAPARRGNQCEDRRPHKKHRHLPADAPPGTPAPHAGGAGPMPRRGSSQSLGGNERPKWLGSKKGAVCGGNPAEQQAPGRASRAGRTASDRGRRAGPTGERAVRLRHQDESTSSDVHTCASGLQHVDASANAMRSPERANSQSREAAAVAKTLGGPADRAAPGTFASGQQFVGASANAMRNPEHANSQSREAAAVAKTLGDAADRAAPGTFASRPQYVDVSAYNAILSPEPANSRSREAAAETDSADRAAPGTFASRQQYADAAADAKPNPQPANSRPAAASADGANAAPPRDEGASAGGTAAEACAGMPLPRSTAGFTIRSGEGIYDTPEVRDPAGPPSQSPSGDASPAARAGLRSPSHALGASRPRSSWMPQTEEPRCFWTPLQNGRPAASASRRTTDAGPRESSWMPQTEEPRCFWTPLQNGRPAVSDSRRTTDAEPGEEESRQGASAGAARSAGFAGFSSLDTRGPPGNEDPSSEDAVDPPRPAARQGEEEHACAPRGQSGPDDQHAGANTRLEGVPGAQSGLEDPHPANTNPESVPRSQSGSGLDDQHLGVDRKLEGVPRAQSGPYDQHPGANTNLKGLQSDSGLDDQHPGANTNPKGLQSDSGLDDQHLGADRKSEEPRASPGFQGGGGLGGDHQNRGAPAARDGSPCRTGAPPLLRDRLPDPDVWQAYRAVRFPAGDPPSRPAPAAPAEPPPTTGGASAGEPAFAVAKAKLPLRAAAAARAPSPYAGARAGRRKPRAGIRLLDFHAEARPDRNAGSTLPDPPASVAAVALGAAVLACCAASCRADEAVSDVHRTYLAELLAIQARLRGP